MRNSDIFALGIDYTGVHLYGSSLDPTTVAYQPSAISNIDKWKSPVLITQGDDDRNVYFSQTVGLVSPLRAHNVEYELLVQPDDAHDSRLYSRWIELLTTSEQFLRSILECSEDPNASLSARTSSRLRQFRTWRTAFV